MKTMKTFFFSLRKSNGQDTPSRSLHFLKTLTLMPLLTGLIALIGPMSFASNFPTSKNGSVIPMPVVDRYYSSIATNGKMLKAKVGQHVVQYYKIENLRFIEDLAGDGAIFVGVNKHAHSFIIAGNYLFDGEMYFYKPTIELTDFLRQNSLFIRLQDKTGALRRQVESLLNGAVASANQINQFRGSTCNSSALRLLDASGVIMSATGKLSAPFTSAFLRIFAEDQLLSLPDRSAIDIRWIVNGSKGTQFESLLKDINNRPLIDDVKRLCRYIKESLFGE